MLELFDSKLFSSDNFSLREKFFEMPEAVEDEEPVRHGEVLEQLEFLECLYVVKKADFSEYRDNIPARYSSMVDEVQGEVDEFLFYSYDSSSSGIGIYIEKDSEPFAFAYGNETGNIPVEKIVEKVLS